MVKAPFLDSSLYSYCPQNYRDSDSCHSFLLLEAIGKSFTLNSLSPLRGTSNSVIELHEEQYRKEAMNQYAKSMQKSKQRATTFAIAKLQEREQYFFRRL